MTKQLIIWQLISKSLQQHIPVMLLYVLQSNGSSPGRQGFCMAVNANGETEGSIGGGIMEHKFVETAKEKLSYRVQGTGYRESVAAQPPDIQDQNSAPVDGGSIKKQYHNKSAATNQSGMICSGEQTILLYTVSRKDAAAIQQIIHSLEQYQNGTLQLSPAGIQFSPDTPDAHYFFTMSSETDWMYREKTGYKNHLFIIGAGHCALALSRMMHDMDFFIHLYDDRSDVKTFHDNRYAHEKTVVADYTELKELVPSGKHHYIIVMTVGYRTDDIAVRALWNKQFAYFGLLGSKSKIAKMFNDYKAEGVPGSLLQCIHAPVGIAIHSQTPEEIAVSIAAEIIQVKNTPHPRP